MVNVISATKAKAAHNKAMLTNMSYTQMKVSVVNAEYDRKDDIKINTPANQDYKVKNDRN